MQYATCENKIVYVIIYIEVDTVGDILIIVIESSIPKR